MLEVFVIFAMEMCAGSAQYARCVEWMIDCQHGQATVAGQWSESDGAERCVEGLPAWATEGM